MADNLQNTSSQYNIPQNIYTANNFEAEQAALISANLEMEQIHPVAELAPRLDERQQAIEEATIAARNAAMAAYAQHEPEVQPQPQPLQVQSISQMAEYRARAERAAYAAPNYGIIEVENKLEKARNDQIAIVQDKNLFSKAAELVKYAFIAPKPLLAEFKDQEKIIGGELVEAMYAQQGVEVKGPFRFFCDEHDWFLYREGHYNDAVHYEVTDGEIRKSQYGHRVPPLPGEEAALRILAPMYFKEVVNKLYPLDAIITDLMSPDEPNVDLIQRAA